jgi:hypothetical protein
MKKIFETIALAVVSLASFAQTNLNGTPDMRFKVNQQLYGTASTRDAFFPSSAYTPSYSIPSNNEPSYSMPSYSLPSYPTPSYSAPTYSAPSTYERSSQMFPTTNSGAPDMRYNVNRYRYGR